MGANRPQLVVDLQSALMRAVGDFGGDERLAPSANRVLAAAAALDYVLMLSTGTAGVRIAHDDAERAIREGVARGADELLAASAIIAGMSNPGAQDFARQSARMLRDLLREERLETDERRFALIALVNA